MASTNLNPFEGWFSKPPKPVTPINLFSLTKHLSFSASPTPSKFASLSSSTTTTQNPEPSPEEEPKGPMSEMLDQFFWESENRPDYRYTPEVEAILARDPVFEKKENPTEEEIKENEEFWKSMKESPLINFLLRAEEIYDSVNEMALKENDTPYRKEDRDTWRKVPHVIGPDGRPMPRKAITTKKESDDKFWDFARQFFFGLWGFRQRPYPSGRPIDVAQAIGYKRLERRYYDFIMRSGGFFYKDRLGRSRGPCELIQLKTAWGGGIIDKHTFVWGEDMDEWAPIHMIYGMERAIATWEVRLGAAATAFLHKLQKGMAPWVPLKGFEKKTYKQAQEEAYESKRRDLAVLEANDGFWPGVRIPSHALFLWASGSELTNILEEDHMPNKYIPKDLRRRLAKLIPGLRPWEVLSVEQAMDRITYNGEWYREPLGALTTGPPYIQNYNKDVMRLLETYLKLGDKAYKKLCRTIPGFDKIMDNYEKESDARFDFRMNRKARERKAEQEEEIMEMLREKK